MNWLAEMYVTLLPGMLAGIGNMVWCKLPVARGLARPIDGGRVWRDGRRLFGDNKTWKGVVGMVGLGAGATVAWGACCAASGSLQAHNLFYRAVPNTVAWNLLIGALIGVAYALFELPTSFIKRRHDVSPGRRASAGWGVAFTVLDQADSIIGMVAVVACFVPMTFGFFLAYLAVGAATHAVVNLALYAVRLRKNPL